MTSLTGRNVRMAIQSIKSTRMRSFLTMVGVIIGVASVITAVSLGEGIRQQVASNLTVVSSDVLSIRPGSLVNRANDGTITSVNYGALLGANSLTDQDFISLKNEFENERCTMQKCSIRKEFLCKINLVLSVSFASS